MKHGWFSVLVDSQEVLPVLFINGVGRRKFGTLVRAVVFACLVQDSLVGSESPQS